MASRVLVPAAPALDEGARYSVVMTDDPVEVRAAQRLRHEVFAGELGAVLTPEVDQDEFDAYCDHLIVYNELTAAPVGTYRLLPPGRVDRLYSDNEFNLRALGELRPALVEAGRSCVHPDHRSGAVVNLLWAGIARYLHLTGYRWLAGCASVPAADAAAVWARISTKHLAPPSLRVTPHRPFDLSRPGTGRVVVPPLLKGYLRLGAWVCGEPADDPDFGVADLFTLLPLDRVDPRYLRHFLGEG
ncbi:GNAT family N-acetyltransferase [Longispora albida]|uniref:GNAT family N-acetyltransferase n=1 Tax=Longispora albida TaxID=203523 RepID=UPI00058CF4D7|nr:GNAT family N-acyltransferase [Longispora albida]